MQEAFRIVSDCLCVIYLTMVANAAFYHSFIVVVDPMVAIVEILVSVIKVLS